MAHPPGGQCAADVKFEQLLTPSVRLNTSAHFGDQGVTPITPAALSQ